MVDLLQQHLGGGSAPSQVEPVLLQLLGEPSSSSGGALEPSRWTLPPAGGFFAGNQVFLKRS